MPGRYMSQPRGGRTDRKRIGERVQLALCVVDLEPLVGIPLGSFVAGDEIEGRGVVAGAFLPADGAAAAESEWRAARRAPRIRADGSDGQVDRLPARRGRRAQKPTPGA
jgi:hypothetical protein